MFEMTLYENCIAQRHVYFINYLTVIQQILLQKHSEHFEAYKHRGLVIRQTVHFFRLAWRIHQCQRKRTCRTIILRRIVAHPLFPNIGVDSRRMINRAKMRTHTDFITRGGIHRETKTE